MLAPNVLEKTAGTMPKDKYSLTNSSSFISEAFLKSFANGYESISNDQ